MSSSGDEITVSFYLWFEVDKYAFILTFTYPNTNSVEDETEKTKLGTDALLKDYSIIRFQAVNMSHY
jgi:hypothetical protein